MAMTDYQLAVEALLAKNRQLRQDIGVPPSPLTAADLTLLTGYEVWSESPDGHTHYYGTGGLTEDDAIAAHREKHPEAVNAELRKRVWAVDPDCEQDSMLCPCNPITEWEKMRDL
jgi:hypothetical protein